MGSSGAARVKPIQGYIGAPDEHISLVIRELPSKRLVWVRAYQATCDFMGWSREFATEAEHKAAKSVDGMIQFSKKSYSTKCAGKRLEIHRRRDRHRPGPQNRHGFRVSTHATMLDIAELAHFTTCDWYWLSGPDGKVRSREEWDAIYQAGGKAPLR